MEVTQTMNAIRCHHRGGPETLIYEPVARPLPNRGEVLVEVHAVDPFLSDNPSWDKGWSAYLTGENSTQGGDR